jgi:hypothetical protein
MDEFIPKLLTILEDFKFEELVDEELFINAKGKSPLPSSPKNQLTAITETISGIAYCNQCHNNIFDLHGSCSK